MRITEALARIATAPVAPVARRPRGTFLLTAAFGALCVLALGAPSCRVDQEGCRACDRKPDKKCVAGEDDSGPGLFCVDKGDGERAVEAGYARSVAYPDGTRSPGRSEADPTVKVKAGVGGKLGPVNVGVEVETTSRPSGRPLVPCMSESGWCSP